jgi:hypothetical protein
MSPLGCGVLAWLVALTGLGLVPGVSCGAAAGAGAGAVRGARVVHRHTWQTVERLMLGLPETCGRWECLSIFRCACGLQDGCTSWSRTTGRHETYAELRGGQRQEQVYGKGKARSAPRQEG